MRKGGKQAGGKMRCKALPLTRGLDKGRWGRRTDNTTEELRTQKRIVCIVRDG